MSFTTIEEYNNTLVKNKTDITIIKYVKKINKLTFKIDISFINDFIELVDLDTCCIHHSMLQKYKVSNLTSGTKEVIVIMEQYGFINGKDYKLGNIPEFNGGRGNKNNYYLHPDTFKICCQRAKNTLVYAKYFILLEKCMKYYNDYENNKKLIEKDDIIIEQNKNLTQKDNKIDTLQDQITILLQKSDEILNNNRDSDIKYNTIIEKLDNITEELVDTKEELVETKEELEDTSNNVRLIAKQLDIAVIDRVSRPKNLSTLEYFIVMRSNTNIEYKYYIIRGQKEHANRQKNKLNEYTEIKTIECCPNANILWRLLKEQLINNFEYHGNKLNIIDMNEDTFLEKIDIIYNTRKIIEIN